jgi:hypothetical protein
VIAASPDRRYRTSLFLVLAVLTAVLSQAGGARAAEPQSASFSLAGSNGFAVDVSREGREVTVIASEGQPPVATFTAGGRLRSAGEGNGASTVYSAAADPVGPGAVDADLGALGTISVRFHPSGERVVTIVRRGCDRTTRFVRRLGTFVGSISFRGEDGYTTVAATSAEGSVGTPPPTTCGPDRPVTAPRSWAPARDRRRPGSAGAVLTAVDTAAGSSFRAATMPGGVSFHAQVEERNADGVTVVRHAAAGAPLSAFAFDGPLRRASVRPPAPFSGNARFVAGSRPAWVGSLRVTFPGLSVPLVGASFRARLRRP